MTKKYSVLPTTKWTAAHLYALDPKPLAMLMGALALMGLGDGLLVLADLGSSPWTVFAQGISLQAHIDIGWASFWISAAVMLLWIPLGLRAGLGTILNIIVIAIVLSLSVDNLPAPQQYLTKFAYASLGILFFGIGSALYLTCHLGAGPRDGLMVGLCYHFRCPVGIVRTIIEVMVCAFGFLLGGTMGIMTLIFALAVGWIVQYTLSFIRIYSA